MKNYAVILLLLICAALQNCRGKGTSKNFEETSDTVKFFPVNLYLKGQIAKVDSQATVIYKIAINNNTGKRDTTIISTQQFNQLAKAFTDIDISDKSIHKYYKESTFADQTTQSLTFNYTAMDSTLPVQSVDVLLSADGQVLKNVFINKSITVGDSTVAEKCGWKNDASFYINRIVQTAKNAGAVQQNVVTWQYRP